MSESLAMSEISPRQAPQTEDLAGLLVPMFTQDQGDHQLANGGIQATAVSAAHTQPRVADEAASHDSTMLSDSAQPSKDQMRPTAELSEEISIADLHIGASNARKRDVPSTSWSDEPNQAFRQKLEPEDEKDEGQSKLALNPRFQPDIDEIKLTQMQLTDRQSSHAQASSLAQPMPIIFTNGHSKVAGTPRTPRLSKDAHSLPPSSFASISHKRAATPLSVSEPSDSPLKRRVMWTSGSDGHLKSLLRKASTQKEEELSDSSEASRNSDPGGRSPDTPHSEATESCCSQPNGQLMDYSLDEAGAQQMALAKLLIGRNKPEDALKVLYALALRFPTNPDVICQMGICHGLTNNRAQAFACFTTATEAYPEHFDSLLACGSLYRSCGLLQDAVALLRRAHSLNVSSFEAHTQLASALSDLATKVKAVGQVDEALALYEEALDVGPEHAQVLYNTGVLQSEKGDFEQALKFYRRAVEVQPAYAEAHCNIGVIYKNRGQTEEAVVHYRNALNASPNFQIVRANLAVALTHLATAAKQHGDPEKCVTMYEEALTYDPKCAEALYNLAVVHGESKQIRRAILMYEMCLLVKPDCAEAHNNLGVLYRGMGNVEKAYLCYMAALHINPKFHQALSNVAVLYTSQGKAHEAHQLFVAAIAASPEYAEAYNNLGVLQRDVGQVKLAIESYEKCIQLDSANKNAGQNRLLALNYIYPGEEAYVCSEHEAWGQEFQARYQMLPEVGSETKSRSEHEKLTVGYVSPDLFTHSVSYFAEAPLAHHTKRVKLKVYSCTVHPDSKTKRLREAVESIGGDWYDSAEKDDNELASQIRSDGVDILVDLTGHTANNRLGVFAMKPSPIQVTWIGYPNSTGLQAVDYRITDALADPLDTKQTFVEELIRLPGCFLCYTPSHDAPPVSDLPAEQLGFITFGSFNALSKITNEVIKVWSQILLAVPNSRLVLKNKPFACPHAQQYFQRLFEAEGIAAERIDLMPLTPGNKDHLATYSFMDISLDPWPYAGTTTTCESLFMGVPVVSLRGQCHAHNVGASLLTTVGIEGEWLASSAEEYIAIAVSAAEDVPLLAALRKGLRDRVLSSPLCDVERFIPILEDQYFSMHKSFRSKMQGHE